MTTATRYSCELTLDAGSSLPRHRHREGYAAIVLAGRVVEAGFAGRLVVQRGDVLLHGSFDCHRNAVIGAQASRIVHVPWSKGSMEGHFRVADPELLMRLALRDPRQATEYLATAAQRAPAAREDWPTALARALADDPGLCLESWARARGMARESVSRGFSREFGVSPRLFRLELRTRRAWNAIVGSTHPLTEIAHAQCFADSAHMSRSVRRFTGFSPTAWRSELRALSGPS
jgi:AraC-like DNA-binding protein